MARQLTPEETALFAADMASLPPEHGADVALKWRERCINLLNSSQSALADGASVAEAALYVGAIGWWQGANEAARDKIVLEWQTVTAPKLGVDPKAVPTPFQDVLDAGGKVVAKAVADPTKLAGVPMTWIPTGLLLLMGVIGVGGAQHNRYILAPALGGFGFGLGTYFRDRAYQAALAKQAATAVAATTTPTTTGGEGNPSYRGYPRAA